MTLPRLMLSVNIRLNTIQSKPAGGVGNKRDQWVGTEEHRGVVHKIVYP